MNLSNINETLDHKIVGGSDYQWECYGPNARFLDYESKYAYCTVVYNSETSEIYQAEVSVNRPAWDTDKKPYRWLNPNTKDSLFAESAKRNIDVQFAWDDVKWIDLEVEEDFLEKAKAMFNGVEFDTRIQMPINLDDGLMLKLCMEAHKRDITLNKMIEILLQETIDLHNTYVNESLV
jgi:hypothetical protein